MKRRAASTAKDRSSVVSRSPAIKRALAQVEVEEQKVRREQKDRIAKGLRRLHPMD